MNFMNVFDSVNKTGGASYNVMTSELNPTTGYMVSFIGYEKVLDKKPTTYNEFSDIMRDYFTSRVWDAIITIPNLFIGLWTDEKTGKFYIDLSQNEPSFEMALELAIDRKQLAIYDCEKGKSFNFADAVNSLNQLIKASLS